MICEVYVLIKFISPSRLGIDSAWKGCIFTLNAKNINEFINKDFYTLISFFNLFFKNDWEKMRARCIGCNATIVDIGRTYNDYYICDCHINEWKE